MKVATVFLSVVIVVSVMLHVWIASEHGPKYTNFARLFTDRLAAGHLDLAQRPDPKLLALKDPYDPVKNEGLRLLDASLYDGHFYLYFGITPFAVLLVPYFLATGQHLSEAAAVAAFCGGGIILYGIFLWVALKSAKATLGGMLAVVVGSTALIGSTMLLVRRPSIYEVEIASAFFFLAGTAACYASALYCPRRKMPLFAWASACIALAIGSRPNYALTAPIWTCWIVVSEVLPELNTRKRWKIATAGLLPMSIIGSLLAAYNTVRFGNPLEFGFRYQMMAFNRPTVGFWSLSNLPYNLFRYLCGTWRMSPYFPFLLGQGRDLVGLPAHHEQTEYIYGVLLTAPCLCFLALLPWLLNQISWKQLGPASLLLAISGVNLFILLGMGNGSYRYLADFLPPALMATAVFVMFAPQVLRLGAWNRFSVGTAVFVCAAWSVFFSLASQFALLDIFRDFNSRSFRTAARIFNTPTFWVAKLSGERPTIPSLYVQLPKNQYGTDEPLLVTGLPAAQDFTYLYLTGPGLAQVGFESIGHGGPVSKPFALDYARPHRFAVYAGNLLPPEGHPMWKGISDDDVHLLQSELVVKMDDQVVLDAASDFHDPKGRAFLGLSPDDAAFGSRFLGRILDSRPVPALSRPSPDRWLLSNYGDLRVRIKIAALYRGQEVPLLSLGNRHAGALVYLKCDAASRLHLVYEADNPHEIHESNVLDLQTQTPDVVDFCLRALHPPITSSLAKSYGNPAAASSDILWNGKVELTQLFQPIDCSPTTVLLGKNAVGFSGVDPEFNGQIVSSERFINGVAARDLNVSH